MQSALRLSSNSFFQCSLAIVIMYNKSGIRQRNNKNSHNNTKKV